MYLRDYKNQSDRSEPLLGQTRGTSSPYTANTQNLHPRFFNSWIAAQIREELDQENEINPRRPPKTSLASAMRAIVRPSIRIVAMIKPEKRIFSLCLLKFLKHIHHQDQSWVPSTPLEMDLPCELHSSIDLI
jgi:hypothetical protein